MFLAHLSSFAASRKPLPLPTPSHPPFGELRRQFGEEGGPVGGAQSAAVVVVRAVADRPVARRARLARVERRSAGDVATEGRAARGRARGERGSSPARAAVVAGRGRSGHGTS